MKFAGGTESNNMVLNSVSKLYSVPHIVISAVEHDSVSAYAKNLLKQVQPLFYSLYRLFPEH